jgi:hypothetical protein
VATVDDLRLRLEALEKSRASGALKIELRDRSTWFKSDAEMASAIADLKRQIAAAEGRRRTTVYITTSKGF